MNIHLPQFVYWLAYAAVGFVVICGLILIILKARNSRLK